jgi:hypothetical protein
MLISNLKKGSMFGLMFTPLTSPEPVEKAVAVLAGLVDRLEKLAS